MHGNNVNNIWQLFLTHRRLIMFSMIAGSAVFFVIVIHGVVAYSLQEEAEWRSYFPEKIPPLNYDPAYFKSSISMDDPHLVAYLKKNFIIPPQNLPIYLYNDKHMDTSSGQSKAIAKIFKGRKKGFFIECGAYDGETRSNTLLLERKYQWTGLLIEAETRNYESLYFKRRNAFLSSACLGVKPKPNIVSFVQNGENGKITDWPIMGRHKNHRDTPCFPLYTFMLALDRVEIDYFSLSIGGRELEALQTIPWGKVDIKTISVGFKYNDDQAMDIPEYLESKGYRLHSQASHPNYLANYFIFVKP